MDATWFDRRGFIAALLSLACVVGCDGVAGGEPGNATQPDQASSADCDDATHRIGVPSFGALGSGDTDATKQAARDLIESLPVDIKTPFSAEYYRACEKHDKVFDELVEMPGIDDVLKAYLNDPRTIRLSGPGHTVGDSCRGILENRSARIFAEQEFDALRLRMPTMTDEELLNSYLPTNHGYSSLVRRYLAPKVFLGVFQELRRRGASSKPVLERHLQDYRSIDMGPDGTFRTIALECRDLLLHLDEVK